LGHTGSDHRVGRMKMAAATQSVTPTLPASAYTSAETWRLEQARIFEQSWLCVGHALEVPETGDAVPFEFAGWRLIIVRDADGRIHAFHNVCRHRAGPLLWSDEGGVRGLRHLQCRYHGWRYALDGRRVASPAFGARLPDGLGLIRVPLATWRGLLFVWLGSSPAVSFDGWIAPLDAETPDILGGLSLHRREKHLLECNWKVYVENYLEGYHIPWMHPALSAEVELARYRVHPGERLVRHAVPTDRDGPNEGLWIWFWPSLALNVYGGGVSIERVVPVGPTQTRVDYLYLFREEAGVDKDAALAMSRSVTAEDVRICESVQQGLASGAVPTGLLSPRHEQGVKAFQDLVRDAWSETR
ncbi:MAG: SRPBCC family protein, partial [Myxococcota bacterium]|nr:SRPBCC family protein [Myxococcota bacterium]